MDQGTTIVSQTQRPEAVETVLNDSSGLPATEAFTTPANPRKTTYGPPTPMSQKERAVIDQLERNIETHEQRLQDIENKQIPSLHDSAKAFLKEKNKAEALKCVARKKRLEQQVDVLKASIFHMETQLFTLENAMEDRHVKKALGEAASAISGLQQSIGDPNAAAIDLTQMNDALPSMNVVEDTDEELMEELSEWLTPEERRNAKKQEHENISILSLPTVPGTTPAKRTSSSSSVQKILQTVLGT